MRADTTDASPKTEPTDRSMPPDTITIDLVCDPDGVSLRIADDGRGFAPAETAVGHHGLSIMRERAQGIGAGFEVQSRPGGGTELAVTWS